MLPGTCLVTCRQLERSLAFQKTELLTGFRPAARPLGDSDLIWVKDNPQPARIIIRTKRSGEVAGSEVARDVARVTGRWDTEEF